MLFMKQEFLGFLSPTGAKKSLPFCLTNFTLVSTVGKLLWSELVCVEGLWLCSLPASKPGQIK